MVVNLQEIKSEVKLNIVDSDNTALAGHFLKLKYKEKSENSIYLKCKAGMNCKYHKARVNQYAQQ